MDDDARTDRRTSRRRPPARRRGETRPLSERAARFVSRVASTDRRQRHERRRREVTEIRRIRRRRRVLASVALWGAVVLSLVGGGWLLAGSIGAAIGAGAVGLVAVGVALARRLAAQRGAIAWDWTVQRYRLLGNPFGEDDEDDRGREGPTAGPRAGIDRLWRL